MMNHCPVEYYVNKGWKVVSRFGLRKDPFGSSKSVQHNGVDFGGKPVGEPITTPYGGQVLFSGNAGSAGNMVTLKTDETGDILIFMHLHQLSVRKGERINADTVVGTNGATGRVTGPHLHFEIRKDNGTAMGNPVWGDPAEYRPVKQSSTEAKETPALKTVTVKPGDTLYKIALAQGVSLDELLKANPQISNPNLVHPGNTIFIPQKGQASQTLSGQTQNEHQVPPYTVKPGDSLWAIATRQGYTVAELAKFNNIANQSLIQVGQVIQFPPR